MINSVAQREPKLKTEINPKEVKAQMESELVEESLLTDSTKL